MFEHLVADASPEDKKALLAGKIEDGLNSVIRQIAFHRFEQKFHAARAEGEVALDQINAIWLEVMGESLGPAIRLNDGYEVYWAYVGLCQPLRPRAVLCPMPMRSATCWYRR